MDEKEPRPAFRGPLESLHAGVHREGDARHVLGDVPGLKAVQAGICGGAGIDVQNRPEVPVEVAHGHGSEYRLNIQDWESMREGENICLDCLYYFILMKYILIMPLYILPR